MKTFFIVTTIIILLFGFSVGAYLSCYTLKLKTTVAKVLGALVLGLLVSAVAFVLSVFAIWP